MSSSSSKKKQQQQRDRWAARVGSALLWPVAKARPDSDWAKMQQRLDAVAAQEADPSEADPTTTRSDGEKNPFIVAAERAARAQGVPSSSTSSSSSPVVGEEAERVDGAAGQGQEAQDAQGARQEPAAAASAAAVPTATSEARVEAASTPPLSPSVAAPASFDLGRRGARSEPSPAAAPSAVRAGSWLQRVPRVPPVALVGLLVGVALLLWLGDWLRPRPASAPAPAPQNTGFSQFEP